MPNVARKKRSVGGNNRNIYTLCLHHSQYCHRAAYIMRARAEKATDLIFELKLSNFNSKYY